MEAVLALGTLSDGGRRPHYRLTELEQPHSPSDRATPKRAKEDVAAAAGMGQ